MIREARHAKAPRAPRQSRRRRFALVALVAATPLMADGAISLSVRVHRDPARVPTAPVALVLGTAPLHQGRPNRFYTARLDAAARLYLSGRVRGLLVSGDNGSVNVDEPSAMKRDLVERGVPAEHITCDFAGFRTLDSVVRAREVFGLERVVVVSQAFHAERAVFLARRRGLSAEAFAAEDPWLGPWLKVRLRELAARSLAWWDLLVGTDPRYLGPPETVGLRERG